MPRNSTTATSRPSPSSTGTTSGAGSPARSSTAERAPGSAGVSAGSAAVAAPAVRRRLRLGPWAPVAVLVVLCAIVAAINPNFLSLSNFVRICQAAMIPLVLGLGATFVILMGSIDLSVEGILALGAVILSLVVLNGANDNNLGVLGIPLVVAVGALMGFLNGLIHVKLRIPS